MKIPENYFWPGLVIAILGMSVSVQAYLVYRATNDNGAQIVDDYYTQAAHHDEMMAAKRASAALEWSAEVTLLPTDSPTRRELQIIVQGSNGEPLSGLSGTAELRSPALARPLGSGEVRELGPGLYRVTIEGEHLDRAGLFDTTVRLSKPQATALFLHEKRHEVL